MTEANRDCQNPICGCGGCDDPEDPERDCPFTLCMCGGCTDDEPEEEDDE